MVAFMVFFMSLFNIGIHQGFSKDLIQVTWLSFPLTFVVAFVLEYFIIGKRAMKLAFKMHRHHHTEIQKKAIISMCIVPFMAGAMSLYGAIMTVGFSKNLASTWVHNFVVNFFVAFAVVLFIVGPLVGYLFGKLFPEGTIVDLNEIK